MLRLCTVEAPLLSTVFGSYGFSLEENTPPKYENLHTIFIGQKPDSSGYLILSNQVVREFTQQYSIPTGYDFIFRQEWGLTITEEILHRVIATLRAEAYPPMADYLDAKVKGDADQEADYLAKCLAVKAKYPKFVWP
jgi:hypothetical protein